MQEVSNNGANWFCLVVEPGCHRQVENHLAAIGYRPFFPKVKRWVSHARVKKAAERPLLGRYLFVEIDFPRQSFSPVMAARGVEAIISSGGTPWPMPRREVDNLFDRYLSGEFDEVKRGFPVGARVAIVAGEFENWIATVTGLEKGGKQISVKLLGHKATLNKLPGRALRPAFGTDLDRGNPREMPA
jgi:transcription antitermination factor NusG